MKNKKYSKFKALSFLIIVVFSFVIIIYNYKSNYKEERKVHISIDDTIKIFKDLTDNEQNFKSIFENDTLKFLRECNKNYGAKFSLYCFYEYGDISLDKCTEKFKEEFEENSEWLQFGFHSYNNSVDYTQSSIEITKEQYESVIKHLKRIVGEKSITRLVRLERFLANRQTVNIFKECEIGIQGLLGADSIDRQNYYLENNENMKLFKKGEYFDNDIGIYFYCTDIRIENNDNIIEKLEEREEDKYLIVFTHEWILNENIKNKIIEICKYCLENNINFTI